MAGTLYLVATPIGNLEDITLRAVRILKEADLIACEDTRTSSVLMHHCGIDTPLISYHKFNEEERGDELVSKLLLGQNIALITDAGMPAISDPGEVLVKKCMDSHIPVTAVPGPSACVTALALSGADTRRFSFEGFLPQENKEKKQALERIAADTRTVILYEAPHRLLRTLRDLKDALGGERTLSLCRELTKKYESVQRMTIDEALAMYGDDQTDDTSVKPRGEYVLVVDGKSRNELAAEKAAGWMDMDIPSHVALYEAEGLDHKAAMKAAAKDRGLSRRDVYQALLNRP